MPETARFFLGLVGVAALATGAILALRSDAAADRPARLFFWVCVIPSAAVLVERVATALGLAPGRRLVENAYLAVWWIVLGAAAASAILTLTVPARAPFARSAWTLRGLCAFTALGYLAIEAGKLANDAWMREFWTGSGYPIWTMYAVMAAEILGAIGLLVQRTRLYAAAGLSLLMLGAIGTHAKNGDPFSDSLDAVRMLVLLGAIAVLTRQSEAATERIRELVLASSRAIAGRPSSREPES